jgi:enhancing lycopene biosynthesis protein 2
MKKFAVILSGCGVYDGSEIHEAVMALYAITKAGASYQIFAPDKNQYHVVNHFTGKPTTETRNILVESARIARGRIKQLKDLDVKEFDALVFPGGFGAAKNLCDFAFKGKDMKVDEDVVKVILSMHDLKKPIGAMCIAPVILAKVIGGAEVTIGEDEGTAKNIEQMGGKHIKTGNGEIVIDINNKVVTTASYMLDANLVQIAEGAENMINAMMKMM